MLRQDLNGCERYFLGVKHVNENVVRYRVFPTRCNSWDCPVCAKIKGEKYRERMRPLFEGGQLFMYTFTYFHKKAPLEVWQEVSKSWNRFRTAASKRFGKFSYARIIEHHHKSPYPHLHVLIDKRFPDSWLNKELLSAGFGYQAVCKPVTTEHAIHYVTKYLTKPWTDKACSEIRKSLGLRVITFGGNAATRALAGTPWELIAKCFVCQDAVTSMMIDLEWKHGQNYEKTFEREFDASGEYTFFIKPGGYDANETTEIGRSTNDRLSG